MFVCVPRSGGQNWAGMEESSKGEGIRVFTRGRGSQIMMCVTEEVSEAIPSHVTNQREGRFETCPCPGNCCSLYFCIIYVKSSDLGAQ